jgi:hypothetical protein
MTGDAFESNDDPQHVTRETRRVIGRILSIGFPLPGPRVDNYNITTAPALFDYDAVVVDPAACGRFIEDVLRGEADAATFAGSRVRAHAEQPGDVALPALIARRRDEAARLLDNGGVVVCFLHPETMHAAVEGARIGDYAWLPDSIREALIAAVVAGEGTQAHVVDYVHPLSAFVAGQAANLTYRAYIDERRAPDARVFARSQGGAAVGAEFVLARGRLVLLPALRALPSGDARYIMSDALQAGIRHALGAIAEGREPSWLKQHPLPGLAEADANLAAARTALDEAQARVAAAETARNEIARYQRLLWQEGEAGIEDVVIDALKLIGCEVYGASRDELEMTIDRESVLFEIEASEHAVGIEAHHRLRQRIERAIERRGSAPRGVLFVNGERLSDPAGREHEVTPQLALAAETMRYCIAPTSSLYAAVAAQMSGDAESVTAYKRALRTTDGVLAAS